MRATIWLTWTQLWRDRRLPVALGVLLALAVVAAWLDRVRAGASERDRIVAEELDRRTFEDQGPRNPHSVAHFSRFAFRPRAAASMLDPGITDYAGAAVWMEAHSQDPPNARAAEDQLDLGRAGELGLAWIWQVVAPLLIIGLAFDAVARERERRTLPIVLIGGQTLSGLVLAKALAVLGLFTAALAVTTVLSAALATGAPVHDPVLRVVLWLVAHVAYLATWTAFALAVSVRARTSRGALALLLACWAFLVLVAPRLVASAVDDAIPIADSAQLRAAIERDLEQGFDGHGPAAERARAFEARVLAQYGVASTAELPVSFAGLQLDEGERVGNLIFDRHYRRLADRYRRQHAWRRALGGPLAAVQGVSMAAATTDLEHQLSFARQAEDQRRDIVGRLNRDFIDHAAGQDFDYVADPALWEHIPTFVYEPPPLGALRPAADLGWSLGWLAAAGLLLAWSVRGPRPGPLEAPP